MVLGRGYYSTYLVVEVVLVDVVFVDDELDEGSHCVHVHRLEFSRLVLRLLVVRERHVPAQIKPAIQRKPPDKTRNSQKTLIKPAIHRKPSDKTSNS